MTSSVFSVLCKRIHCSIGTSLIVRLGNWVTASSGTIVSSAICFSVHSVFVITISVGKITVVVSSCIIVCVVIVSSRSKSHELVCSHVQNTDHVSASMPVHKDESVS